MTHLLANLGCVDFYLGCSTLCLVLPEVMGSWQNWLGKMVEQPKSMSTQPRFAKRWVTAVYCRDILQHH